MTTHLGGSVIQLSLRGDTLARWTEFNPVLGERELVLETDTRRFKMGNGVADYLALAYAGVTSNYPVSTTVTGANLDLSAGGSFKKVVTEPLTLTVSNAAPAGFVSRFMLQLTNAGADLVWFSGICWPGGIAPTLTVVGIDRLSFESDDAGATWHAQILSLNSKALS
jgi:hypothetical protein